MKKHATNIPNIPSRNAPCACGSGKKSKRCCGAAPPVQQESARKPWLLVTGLLGVIAIAIYAVSVNRPSSVSGTAQPPPAGVSAPKPWQYDAVSDQHWEPSHQHWHPGRPPVSAGETNALPPVSAAPAAPALPAAPPVPAAKSGKAPKPWQYDVANNQHWDPAHQHWHRGPPPPQAPRP